MTARSHTRRVALGLAWLLGATALTSVAVPAASPVAAAAPTDLIISEYVEGSSFNKAIELYNGTGAPVDLAAGGYEVQLFSNGNAAANSTLSLSGTIAPGGTFVAANPQASAAILAVADVTNGGAINWNGDDAIVLAKSDGVGGDLVVDSFGQVGVDPGSEWPGGSTNDTLRRLPTVCSGDTDPSDAFDASTEWQVLAQDTFDGLGTHTIDCAPAGPPTILINEVDADQPGTDSAEFVELTDGGVGNTDLSGLTLVFFNGSNDLSYDAIDLDGISTNADGYAVVCANAVTVANCDLDDGPDTNFIHNGADAIALYEGDAVDFPNGTAITTVGLLDAIVHDTDDADDAELLALLAPGQPQVNENANGAATTESMQRCPDGSGAALETSTYATFVPTPGAANTCEIVVPPLACTDGAVLTLISTIQGAGGTSPLVGASVVVEGVVTSILPGLGRITVQEEPADSDGDPATSEGISVFGGTLPAGLAVGTTVRVAGTVGEFTTSGGASSLTEIAPSAIAACDDAPITIEPTPVTLPLAGPDALEAVEGMLVTLPQALTISEYFNFDRFGEVVLSSERLLTPTAEFEPGPAAIAAAEANLLARITIDDARSVQNPDPAIHPGNGGAFDLTNLFRGGDTIAGITGVIEDTFGLFRLQPTTYGTYTQQNPRQAAPDAVGGDITVASFNVLNYFTTLDDGVNDICGPSGTFECRGADTAEELVRQRDKIVAAISAIDADVVGLIEIENNPTDDAVIDLVDSLNAVNGPGTYASIDTGAIGTDAIKVAFIYQPASVTPVGDFAVLDGSVDARFLDSKNRPALAQTFADAATGGTVTVAVNHLKSKGSACVDVGDPDTGDGSGNCNGVRTAAAEALVDWLASDPTGSGDADVLIIGDLNAYDTETPIDAIIAGADDTVGTGDDYADLVAQFGGEAAYSYVFDGQFGYLDHALANSALLGQVTGTTVWHVNADEPDLLDYDTTFKLPAQDAIYAPDPFRSSDHDPVIIGLELDAEPVDQPLRLTLLHNNDGESALLPAAPVGGIARFATLVDGLRTQAALEPGNADSLLVSSGDNFLAGPQLQASLDNYDGDTDYTNDGPFYDAIALDRIGYDASAIGNHEFDFGPQTLGYFLSEFDTSNIRFVSSNLDVTGDAALAQFVDTAPGAAGTLVEWTTVDAGGERVAIVGATTPRLPSISSPGPDVVLDPDVRAAVQDAIDAATADGTDIVILISHLQNIAEDQALIAELSGLDIAVAGGGDELLANADDPLLPGSGPIFAPYPIIQTAADGAEVPIVTTQGSYGYVGRLIVDIDVDGNVVAIDDRSGPVRNVFDPDVVYDDAVEPDPFILANVEAPVAAYVAGLQGDVIATTEPALDGVRGNVRTQETNLGSFFADALRVTAEDGAVGFGSTRPTVALTNAGGIRNDVVLGPNGDVTTFDTFQIAPFSNFVSAVVDVNPETLKALLERGVSANLTTGGTLAAEGRFAQLSGMELVYDPTQPAQQVSRDADGVVTITTPGQRVRQLTLTLNDDDPSNDIVVVRNGVIVPGAPSVDLATNSFTIGNGDDFPFNLADGEFVNLPVTYQQSLANYFIGVGKVTADAYPEGGLGRITVGGGVVDVGDLDIDRALIVLGRRGGGTAIVQGSVDATFSSCPRLGLSIEGQQVADRRFVRIWNRCYSLNLSGYASFDLRTSTFTLAISLPRSFGIAETMLDFELTLGDETFAAAVDGRRIGRLWTAI